MSVGAFSHCLSDDPGDAVEPAVQSWTPDRGPNGSTGV